MIKLLRNMRVLFFFLICLIFLYFSISLLSFLLNFNSPNWFIKYCKRHTCNIRVQKLVLLSRKRLIPKLIDGLAPTILLKY